MSDLSHADFLQNFGDDPQIQLIALQIEEIHDGTRFLELSSRITKTKPIIALKAGRTQSGVRAVAAHTGSLAGNDTVYDTAFKQAGIIRAYDMKPIVISGVRDEKGSRHWSALQKRGITAYSSIRRAIKSLAIAYSRYRYLNTKDHASNPY